ncbi:MAG: hypothetical protein U0R52_12380 [Solirubrobacterales bacterium]
MEVAPRGTDLTGDGPDRRRPRAPAAGVTLASVLEASPEAVWRTVTSPAGIADEMRPLLRMTFPIPGQRLDAAEVPPGRRLGRCWLLLFGVVPFEFDDLTLVRIEPGRGFLERSTMLSLRLWEHERTLEPVPEGCLLTDRLGWEVRLGLPAGPLRPLVGRFFAHRHRRLRRRFGGRPA